MTNTIAQGIYPGEKWQNRDPRMLIPATVLSVDDKFVYIEQFRKSKVRLDRFLKHFNKVAHSDSN